MLSFGPHDKGYRHSIKIGLSALIMAPSILFHGVTRSLGKAAKRERPLIGMPVVLVVSLLRGIFIVLGVPLLALFGLVSVKGD